jgi:hypothetical protein
MRILFVIEVIDESKSLDDRCVGNAAAFAHRLQTVAQLAGPQ